MNTTQLGEFTAVQAQTFNDKALAYLSGKGYSVIGQASGTNAGLSTTKDVGVGTGNLASLITAGSKAVNITGGTGADTIFGSALNDTISGGGTGADSITAGSGNDTITFQNIGDTVDGSAGKDTLAITTAYIAKAA